MFSFKKYIPVKREPQISDSSSTIELTENPTIDDTPWVKPESRAAPKYLGEWGIAQWGSIATQCLLTVASFLFIILGATAISLHKTDTSDSSNKGNVVKRVIQLSPTIFPILFAAITGRFLRILGLFLAQRGAKLGTLERLSGSHSLFTAFERQIVLRSSSILGLGIIFLWALSPVGGQSALRLLSVNETTYIGNGEVEYLPMEAKHYSIFTNPTKARVNWVNHASIYLAALRMGPGSVANQRDIFGNLRIPPLDSWSNSSSGWHLGSSRRYPSLLGVPIIASSGIGNITSFTMKSRYFDVDCYDHAYYPNFPFQLNADDRGQTFRITVFHEEPRRPFPEHPLSVYLTSISGPGKRMNESDESKTNPTYLSPVSIINCTIGLKFVESRVACGHGYYGDSCEVQEIRNLTTPEALRDQQTIDDEEILRATLDELPSATSGYSSKEDPTGSSLTEVWLKEDRYTDFNTERFINLSDSLDLRKGWGINDFSENFAKVINTFYQSGYWGKILTGAVQMGYSNTTGKLVNYSNLTGYDDPTGNGTKWGKAHFNRTEAIYSWSEGEKYSCNMMFASFLILISIFLLLESLSTLFFMSTTIAPDIFGYVATCAWDHPSFATMPSHMDGLDRAKTLKDVRFMVGDVKISEEVGHIAFVPALEAHELRKNRLYD